MFIKSYPEKIDFLCFFETEPVFEDNEDLRFAYKTKPINGLSLGFYFCALEGWMRAKLILNDKVIVDNTLANINKIQIKKEKTGDYIYSESIVEKSFVKMKIYFHPQIYIEYSSTEL